MLPLPSISQTTFEAHVPAFRNAQPYIFQSLAVYIDEATLYVQELTEPLAMGAAPGQTMQRITQLCTRLICLRAARRAVPSLDLILTENGFGIVSNQNLTPASANRVDALRVSLRQQESQTEDLLLFTLLQAPSWAVGTNAQSRTSSLLWCPTLLRRYGVTLDGREAYAEEHRTLQPRIEQAEELVRRTMGPELHAALLERQRTHPADTSSPYALITEQARKLMAIAAGNPTPRSLALARERLLDTLHRHEALLPEYRESSTCQADHYPTYQNRDEDHTYFFS